MTDYVFDTEPLIAYLYDEPGASEVSERLAAVYDETVSGAISHATAAEVVYKIARFETSDPNEAAPTEADLEVGREDLRVLRGFGLSVETPPSDLVARVKAPGGIALGDAYAVALAVEADATLVVGSDPEFDGVTVELEVLRVRSDPS